MSILNNLPHRCTISKRTRTVGSMGGGKTTLSTVSTGVKCWAQAASNRDVLEYQKLGMIVNRKVYFAAKPNVTENNVIQITSLDAGVTTISNPPELEVRSEPRPDASAGKQRVWKVMCQEETGVA